MSYAVRCCANSEGGKRDWGDTPHAPPAGGSIPCTPGVRAQRRSVPAGKIFLESNRVTPVKITPRNRNYTRAGESDKVKAGQQLLPRRTTRQNAVLAAQWSLLVLCVAALVFGSLAVRYWPQRPDGDATALAEFSGKLVEHPTAARLGLLDVRRAFWYNLAGAVLAVWALNELLATPLRLDRSSLARAALLSSGLLWLTGWGWTQSTGWWGDLFLAPGQSGLAGTSGDLEVTFQEFLVPPAPSGPGRALSMRVAVNGKPVEIAVRRPYRQGGWRVEPHWYGGVVQLAGAPPLYFGRSESQATVLPDGRRIVVTLDMETLTVSTAPPVPVTVIWFAVVRAAYDPGRPLRQVGLLGLIASGAAFVITGGNRVYLSSLLYRKRRRKPGEVRHVG